MKNSVVNFLSVDCKKKWNLQIFAALIVSTAMDPLFIRKCYAARSCVGVGGAIDWSLKAR